jgi:hypothetical protein
MKKHLWKVMGLVALLALLVGAAPLAAQEPEPAGPINSLRVYGRGSVNAKFPYDAYFEPYDLTADAAPPKDFVQFNPAFIHPWLGTPDPLGRFLKCGYDAGEMSTPACGTCRSTWSPMV